MTFLNTCNTGNHSTIQLPHKPGAIQDTLLLPPARMGQNSAESLCRPGNGDVPFRVIRIKEAGVEDGSMCRLSNILGSADRGFQATVEDESVGRKIMKLEIPGGERRLDVDAVKHNLGAGRYKAKTFRDHEGGHVCQLRENVGLRGGMHALQQDPAEEIVLQLRRSGSRELRDLGDKISRSESMKSCLIPPGLELKHVLLVIKAIQLGLMPDLKLLDLSMNDLGVEGVRALSQVLQAGYLPNLKILSLSGKDLKGGGVEILAQAIIAAGLGKQLKLKMFGRPEEKAILEQALMDIKPGLNSDTQQRINSVENSEAQVWKSVGVTQEQFKLWVEEGRLDQNQPQPMYETTYITEKNIAKEIRSDIANKIKQAPQNSNQILLSLNGINLPAALQQLAYYIDCLGLESHHLDLKSPKSRLFTFRKKTPAPTLTLESEVKGRSVIDALIEAAVGSGGVDSIRALCEWGADINKRDFSGPALCMDRKLTLLHHAVLYGENRNEVIHTLLKLGADPNALDKDGRSPAHFAACMHLTDVICTLHKFGADLNLLDSSLAPIYSDYLDQDDPSHSKHKHNRLAPIHYAIEGKRCFWDMGQLGLQAFMPIKCEWPEISDFICTLHDLGVDINKPDSYGRTPIRLAADPNNNSVSARKAIGRPSIRTLLMLGADPNIQDKDGWSLAHAVAYKDYLLKDDLRTYYERGVHFNIPDKNGKTPLDIAKERKQTDFVRFLSDLEANPNIQNSEDEKLTDTVHDIALPEITHLSQILEVIHNQDALQVINDDKQLTLENLKTWVDKTQNAKDALLAIQAVRVADSNGHIKIKNSDGTQNVEVQNEVSAILTAAQTNVVDNIKDPQEQEQQLWLIEHMARLCLGDTVGLLSNTQYWNLAALMKHTIKIEHLHAKVNETQEQMKNINTQFQKHIFNVQELAQVFQENLDNLKTNQQDIADKIIEIGKRMRNIRIASAIVNTAQTAINFIPFAGPIISSLGGAAYNASVATQAHDVLVGLHEFKAGLVSAAASLPDAKDLTLGDIITETQGTSFGQLKLNTVLDSIQEQYIYHQLGKLEKELRKPLPEPVLVKPQLMAGSDKPQDQQDNVSAPVASSSHQSSEETIPDADPQLAVTLEDTQENQSMLDDDADSVASSGMKTEDERDHRNIVMSAVKHNSDPDFFSKLLKKNSGKLNHVVTNRKGTSSSAFDFSGHYGRPELAQLLMDENVQSARNTIPFKVLQAADENKDKYDDEGRRKQP